MHGLNFSNSNSSILFSTFSLMGCNTEMKDFAPLDSPNWVYTTNLLGYKTGFPLSRMTTSN